MSSIPEVGDVLTEVLNERARSLARETGLIQRERAFDGADFAQGLIFAWIQEPDLSLEGLCQVLGRREVSITASGLFQRFGPESAAFFERLLAELTATRLTAQQAAPSAVLRRFSAVIVEDSSVIGLPNELAERWRGYGGHANASQAAIKLYVRWDVLNGQLDGPLLTNGKNNDRKSPFPAGQIPAGALYLADLGFFGLQRLRELTRRQQGVKGYVITRWFQRVGLLQRSGHRIELRAILPTKVGEAREFGVLVGLQERLPMRLLLVRVPREVAQQRRQRLREEAQDHGCPVSEEALYLADWLILLTNAPRRLLSGPEVIVCARLRWQIECLFRLWKQEGKIDEWRSTKPYRILTELYAKLCAMVIQQWLLHQGCWQDEHRSLFKAAHLLRRESNRLMMALLDDQVLSVLQALIEQLRRFAGQRTRRKARPGTDQLLAEGLDWPILFLT